MNTKVADFFEYKKRFNPQVIYVGDIVEWQDYDCEAYEGKVIKIEHKALDGFDFKEVMTCLPLWEKEEYVVHLEGGMSIIGETIVRKVVKKASEKKTKDLQRVKYAH